MNCKIDLRVLGQIFIIYMIACVYYIIATQNIGTPFKDSLSEAQLKIKKRESKKRAKQFWIGVLVGTALVYFFVGKR